MDRLSYLLFKRILLVQLWAYNNLIKNTPGVKKGGKTKTGLAEKHVKSNGRPMPPGFDRLESFGHDELTAKRCYFRCSRPPDVHGIKM